MTAQYRVLTDTFIAPYYVRKGSTIATASKPGPHLEPLNDEAREAFELWYDKSAINKRTGDPIMVANASGELVQKMCKPHAKYRQTTYEEPARVGRTISTPAADDMTGTLDLAAARFSKAEVGELRPRPAQTPASAPTPAKKVA